MFTGLIEAVGIAQSIQQRNNYRVLTIASSFEKDSLHEGESICCDGACLTIVSFTDTTFTVEVSQETLARTIAGKYTAGSQINLERSLRASDRLGGHFVTGHIDMVGEIQHVCHVGESFVLNVVFEKKYDHLVIEKGSVAMNGVSLTVNEVQSGRLAVNLIPYTLSKTNLGSLKTSDPVNLEFDLIGKYVAKSRESHQFSNITNELLSNAGW